MLIGSYTDIAQPVKQQRGTSIKSELGKRDPETLAVRRAVRELALDAHSPNTERSERVARRYWAEWYRLRYGKRGLPLPLPAVVIMQFIVDHAERTTRDGQRGLKTEMPARVERELVRLKVKKPGPYGLATIMHRVSMIARINREHLNGEPNPAADPAVRDLLRTLRLAYAKRNADEQRQMPALTVEPLNALLKELELGLANPTNKWAYRRALRDRALLLFAFNTGGRRRSEVTAARVERLKVRRDGTYEYMLGPTKSTSGKEDNEDRKRPVKGRAAKAMKAWLQEARLKTGPLFPRIARDGTIVAKALTPESVRNLMVRLSAQAEFDERYSAHSLRSGYMTEASNRGISLAEAMAFSGHRSVQSAVRYYRSTKKEDSPAADLLE